MKITRHLIPLSWLLGKLAKEIAQENNGRIQNWRDSVPTFDGKIGLIKSFDCGRYSRKCTYTKWEYAARCRSWGCILPNGDLVGVISRRKFRLKPWRGYRWDADVSGIRLVSNRCQSDDYHPNSDDIEEGMRVIVGRLRSNASVRKEGRKRQRLDARKSKEIEAVARKAGLKVCVADSIAAGNCLTGTINFCQRHGFDPHKSYTPAEVLAKSNGDSQRARIVIQYAMRWHQRVAEIGGEVFYPKR